MRLNRLSVKNFRNLRDVIFFPDQKVSVLYGDNAQGKTNLIEAVYLMSGQKSFRSVKESELISFGEEYSRIEADFDCGGREQNATLFLGQKKEATLNGVRVAPSGLTGQFLAVVFSPGELSLVQEGPVFRRDFLDGAISQVMPRYLSTMNALGRVIAQRNTILADGNRFGSRDALEPLLESWDMNFARVAYSILRARSRFIDRLQIPAGEIYSEIAGGKGPKLTLLYEPGIAPPQGESWSGVSQKEGETHLREELLRCRGEDFRNYCTTHGPHRDNMEVLLDGVSARSFGSQGQQRSCALSLKLAQCRVMEETLGEAPIVLLDDVLSELDRTRRDFFLKEEHPFQIILTSCDRQIFRSVRTGSCYRVKGGELGAGRKKIPEEKKAPPPKTKDGKA